MDFSREGDNFGVRLRGYLTAPVDGDFVFIGAGGGALKLLEHSDIPEGRGYGGFPVSGQFLRCTNPEVVLPAAASTSSRRTMDLH